MGERITVTKTKHGSKKPGECIVLCVYREFYLRYIYVCFAHPIYHLRVLYLPFPSLDVTQIWGH